MKTGIKLFFIGFCLFAIVAGCGKNKDSGKTVASINTTSFFVENKEGNYALFSEEGKQITDFIYTDVHIFRNGKSIVKKKEEVGIISDKGKMVVDFGKYKSIYSAGPYYKAYDKNRHTYYIDGNGKVLYDLEKDDVDISNDTDNYSLLENKTEKKYSVLNASGKTIFTFKMVDNVVGPKILSDTEDGIVSLFYNNKNIILNVKSGKEIASFDDSQQYCVDTVKNEEKEIYLQSCTTSGNKHFTYKVIDNGKVKDISSECDQIYFYNEPFICRVNGQSGLYTDYLLGNNYKKVLDIHKFEVAYIDTMNYVKSTQVAVKPELGVDFYKDGKMIKQLPCYTIVNAGPVKNNFYLLYTYPTSKECTGQKRGYEFFKVSGEKAFDKTFAEVKNFNENGQIVVSEDKKNYYLLDSNGNQVGGLYDEIYFPNDQTTDYYIVTKNKQKGIIDKTGKEIIPLKYKKIEIENSNNKIYALLITAEKQELYDLGKNKAILSSTGKIDLQYYYIKVTINETKQYYSYKTEKLFYEE